jgi:hypothetical protein
MVEKIKFKEIGNELKVSSGGVLVQAWFELTQLLCLQSVVTVMFLAQP